MCDKKIIALVVLLIVLSLGHDFDHIARGDIRWQLLPIVIFFGKYAFLGLGLFFTRNNKLGPLFWAIAAGIGVALSWLAHFSPFTDKLPISFIMPTLPTPPVFWRWLGLSRSCST